MKKLKTEKEKLRTSIETQRKSLSAVRQEQKELQTALFNIDAILKDAPTQKKTISRSQPDL